MITPDEYRYAKSHLRAALAHLKLASHYVGREGEMHIQSAVSAATGDTEAAYEWAEAESLKPFTPKDP